MIRFALIHRERVVDLIEMSEGQRPFRSDLPGSIWIDVTHREQQPAVGWRFDGISFKEPGA